MYQQIREYDLRDEAFEILPVAEEPSDYQKLFDFIDDMLYEREYEVEEGIGKVGLQSDIIINDDKLLEDISIPQVIGFLHDYFWSKRSIEMVTVHVMTCGKMTIACYSDDEGLISRIVIE